MKNKLKMMKENEKKKNPSGNSSTVAHAFFY